MFKANITKKRYILLYNVFQLGHMWPLVHLLFTSWVMSRSWRSFRWSKREQQVNETWTDDKHMTDRWMKVHAVHSWVTSEGSMTALIHVWLTLRSLLSLLGERNDWRMNEMWMKHEQMNYMWKTSEPKVTETWMAWQTRERQVTQGCAAPGLRVTFTEITVVWTSERGSIIHRPTCML